MELEGTKIEYFSSSATGVEFLLGRLDGYQYSLHSHDTFIIAAIAQGVGDISISGTSYYPRVGQLIFCNPFEVHDGTARSADMRYRASYPAEGLLNDIASESTSARGGGVHFRQPIVHDPVGARLFLAAHKSSQRGISAIEAQEKLFIAYSYCLSRHAGVTFAPSGTENGPIDLVVGLLSDAYQANVTLADLVIASGLPRLRLIRAFRRRTGLTPHAFLINRRVDVAKQLLRRGEQASAVAAAAGFNDQAHLTRMFKARVGVTPGIYQKAVCHP